MPPFGPISRRKLIAALRDAGFAGPFIGSDHEIMVRGETRIRIPNPHRGDISRNLLAEILRQAGISRQEWERLQ
jgi:predicted RNA binding protein YcfA (HicA-like mRNA interferase family)